MTWKWRQSNPWAARSGTSISNLYQLIEAGGFNISSTGDPVPAWRDHVALWDGRDEDTFGHRVGGGVRM